MKIWQKPLAALMISSFALSISQISFAQEAASSEQFDLELDQTITTASSEDASANIEKPDEQDKTNDDTAEKIELSPWSISAFYLYNFNNDQHLLVPSPGFKKNGFDINAQKASYSFKKLKGFESQISTDWSIGQDENAEDKFMFNANASIKRRVVVAVPFLEVSQGLSLKYNYSQVNTGASSFIPTPWFFILPKYTATYNSADMNQYEFGIQESGWSSGWGVTILKPINDQWTFLGIYSSKKLSEDLRETDDSKQSLMMILSYQFEKGFKIGKFTL